MKTTILIVDDEAPNLASLKMLLKYGLRGTKIETAQSFDDAVKRLARPGISLVLSDVNLDTDYGPSLRALYKKIPFVYLTGDHNWKVPAGDPSKLLYKPYDLDDLLNTIKLSLGESMNLERAVRHLANGDSTVTDAVNYLLEVSPPGFSGTTKAMKDRHSDEIDNPYALAWYMYKKGDKPHKTPETDAKGIKRYIPPEDYEKRKKKAGKVVAFPGRKKRLAASLEN